VTISVLKVDFGSNTIASALMRLSNVVQGHWILQKVS
jgi:hypothetical protein